MLWRRRGPLNRRQVCGRWQANHCFQKPKTKPISRSRVMRCPSNLSTTIIRAIRPLQHPKKDHVAAGSGALALILTQLRTTSQLNRMSMIAIGSVRRWIDSAAGGPRISTLSRRKRLTTDRFADIMEQCRSGTLSATEGLFSRSRKRMRVALLSHRHCTRGSGRRLSPCREHLRMRGTPSSH
jgi:hypothetical protein